MTIICKDNVLFHVIIGLRLNFCNDLKITLRRCRVWLALAVEFLQHFINVLYAKHAVHILKGLSQAIWHYLGFYSEYVWVPLSNL